MSSSSNEKVKQTAETAEDVEGEEVKEEEPTVEQGQHPLLSLANDLFLLSSPDVQLEAAERKSLFEAVQKRLKDDQMVGFTQHLEAKRTDGTSEAAFKFLSDNGWKFDSSAVATQQAQNDKEVEAANAKIQEATEVAGDTEVREAMLVRANLYAKWGNREKALEEYNLVFEKTVGVASKIDVYLSKLRISLAFLDTRNSHGDPNLKQFKADLDKAKA